jgi:hypothetical protein
LSTAGGFMGLITNDIVRRYFDFGDITPGRILEAMEAPILKGERYLDIGDIGPIGECIAVKDILGLHYWAIRLPEEFQKLEECDGEIACTKCFRARAERCGRPVRFERTQRGVL